MNYIAERRLEEKERRRAEIVDAAEAAGRELGLDGLTMDDVARRARLSRALLYVYFQDRSDLMFGLAERAMTLLHSRFVDAAARNRLGIEQVIAIGRSYVAFSQEFPVLFDALARCELQTADPAVASPSELAKMELGDKLHAVLVGSLAGLVLSVTSAVYGFAWGVGLFSLALAWLATTGLAFVCIKRRNINAHRQWMVRSYIITFAFVLFRITTDFVPSETLWDVSLAEMSVAMIWPVWVLPLLAYEVYLQYRER